MPRRLLLGHFLQRLVENDLVETDADRREVLAFVLSALVGFGTVLSAIIATKYLLRPLQSRGWTAIVGLDDTFAWAGASMLVMAGIALVAWDALSLDARDAEVLGVLPVRHRAIVGAQIAAVALLAVGAAAGLNLVPALAGPIVRLQRLPIGLGGLVTATLAHGVATMAAGLFGFFAIVAVREVLVALLGRRAFARLSGIVQATLVVSCAALVLMLPGASAAVERQWLASGAPAPPPLWFLGIHETLAGESLIRLPPTDVPRDAPRHDTLGSAEARLAARYRRQQPAFRALAVRGAAALGAVLIVAVMASAWNNRRLPPPLSGGLDARGRRRTARPAARLTASPAMRAGFDFARHVLGRSAPHRLIVALTAGVAVACATWALSSMAGDASDGSLTRVLSGQALVVFVLAAGVRRSLARTASAAAATTFVLAGDLDAGAFRDGVKRAATLTLALPALLVLLPAHAWALGGAGALWHALVGLALWLVVTEAALPADGVPYVTPIERSDNQVVVGILASIAAIQAAGALGWLERMALDSVAGRLLLPAALLASWWGLRLRASRAEPPVVSAAMPSTETIARLRLGE